MTPFHGSLSGTTPNLTYTPNKNFYGTDNFTFKVNDGLSDSAYATVLITISPVNDPPTAVGDAVKTTEDTPAVNINVLANDIDVVGLFVDSVNASVDGHSSSWFTRSQEPHQAHATGGQSDCCNGTHDSSHHKKLTDSVNPSMLTPPTVSSPSARAVWTAFWTRSASPQVPSTV